MRLNNYIDKTLNEKVTKKEKNEALKNDNIWIGVEFEFKLNEPLIPENSNIESKYESAMTDYNNYNSAVQEYQNEYDEYIDETDRKKNKIEELEEELDKLEDSISETDNMLSDIEDKLNDIDSDDEDNDEEFLIDRKNDLSDDKKSEELEISDLESRIFDLEDDIKYREDEGIYEQIETPYLDQYDYADYISYMQDHMYLSIDDITPEPGEELTEMPYYEDDYEGDFVESVESSYIVDDFPFNDYEVGEYGAVNQSKGTKTWGIESDETVTGDDLSGIEVKSPPMKLPKFIPKVLNTMLNWINDIGYTNNSTGLHVHMSLDKTKGIDPLKLILFLEEGYIYNLFPDRRSSSWVKSVKDKLKSSGTLSKKDLNNFINKKDMMIKIASSHTDGINILNLEDGHVEFRYMGSDYSNSEKDITDVIASYAYWLSLAADPEFKRKEYIQKINRILNKTELFEYMYNITYLKEYMKKDIHAISSTKVQVLINKYKKKLATLSKTYKLDKTTRTLLTYNDNYINSLERNIDKLINSLVHKDDINKTHNIYYDTIIKLRK